MTANPKPSAEAARRAAIKHRRETSAFWMAVHLLGSLNVAVVLLVSIAGMIAFATFMESRFDTAVARYYIYDNPLFTAWLIVLVLNLLCAAFTRWPWQRKHVGFVVTHAGIILMLTGAMVGRAWGFEAFVTLDKTKAARAPAHHQGGSAHHRHIARPARRDAVRRRDAPADRGPVPSPSRWKTHR